MAKINIKFNDINYSIDESSFAAAASELQRHLSTTMSGSGSVVNFGGVSYNIDSEKVSHLATIAGSGSKVVVNGVEYSFNSDKVQNAVYDLEAVLSNLNNPDDVVDIVIVLDEAILDSHVLG